MLPEYQDSAEHQQLHGTSKCQKSKDENSVNREIATLLLNLASRTQNNCNNSNFSNGENFKRDCETEAMDLSTYSRSKSGSRMTPPPAATTVNVTNPNPSPVSSLPPTQTTSHNPYTLPLNSLNNSSVAANLGSSYLLQNLLIGQIQNLTSSQQQQPAHTLVQSCQKSLAIATNLDAALPSESQSSKSGNVSSLANSNSAPQMPLTNLGSSTIPLLSGHIVAQLNSLLFSVHGLADKALEINVQNQLAAIYSRLQEIVSTVSMAKKMDSKSSKPESLVTSSTPKPREPSHKSIVDSKLIASVTDEQKITKQLEEYQRALLKSNQKNETGQFNSNQSIAKILESQTQNSPEPLKLDINNRKSFEDSAAAGGESPIEQEATSVLENLRRRASKDSFNESPPEKRMRGPSVTPVSTALSPQPTSSGSGSARNKSSGKGGKGIRNRVFCGDCPGCLKNDDCGQCRYCRDKTKFGGQNRLRQKCLHRRCQMDTHRRSNGSSNTSSNSVVAGTSPCEGVSTSPGYSGVDLARYTRAGSGGGVPGGTQHGGPAGANDADGGGGDVTRLAHHKTIAEHSIFTSLLGQQAPGLLRDARYSGDKELDVSGANGVDTIQTRSDKWKAKHEAMLKLAVSPPGPLSIAENLSSQNNDSDTEPEPQSPTQQVFENKNLVITIKDALKENNENNTIGDDTNDKVSSRNPHNRPRHPDRNHSNKIKNSESKKDVSRLTTRSMKPVFAL